MRQPIVVDIVPENLDVVLEAAAELAYPWE